MNPKIKNYLGGVVILGVLAAGYAALSYVNSYGKSIEPSSFRSFSVSGDGTATAIPDVAAFSFQVITQGGKDIGSLQAKNTEAANKAIAFLKSEGVETEDIKTQYYNVDPRYETYDCSKMAAIEPTRSAVSCPPSSIVGYTVSQSVGVKIRDFDKIGNIMSGIVESGANQVGSLSFTIDDPTKIQAEARAEAISKAREKAEEVAEAGGFKVGRLLGMQEGYDRYSAYKSSAGGYSLDSSYAPSPTIEPGSQEISVSVTMQYEID